MLDISPEITGVFRERGLPVFCERVRSNLEETYPHFLSGLARSVQSRVVGNMVDRANGWGLRYQDSLYAFCQLMVEVAPNFDELSEIAQAIQALGNKRDLQFAEFSDLGRCR